MSSLWCQIHADVMERTIERVAEPLHTNLRGAALLAALALGAVDRTDVRDLVPVDRVFEPDSSAGEGPWAALRGVPRPLQGPAQDVRQAQPLRDGGRWETLGTLRVIPIDAARAARHLRGVAIREA